MLLEDREGGRAKKEVEAATTWCWRSGWCCGGVWVGGGFFVGASVGVGRAGAERGVVMSGVRMVGCGD